jgi:hypothetical protein
MRPEHDARRAIIREWMALPKEKRQIEEHAAIFAKKAVERVLCSGDRYQRVMGWLLHEVDYMWPGSNMPIQKVAFVTKVGDQVYSVGSYPSKGG